MIYGYFAMEKHIFLQIAFKKLSLIIGVSQILKVKLTGGRICGKRSGSFICT
jgi:hypothetical protein